LCGCEIHIAEWQLPQETYQETNKKNS
jgi:hypothetical protein